MLSASVRERSAIARLRGSVWVVSAGSVGSSASAATGALLGYDVGYRALTHTMRSEIELKQRPERQRSQAQFEKRIDTETIGVNADRVELNTHLEKLRAQLPRV